MGLKATGRIQSFWGFCFFPDSVPPPGPCPSSEGDSLEASERRGWGQQALGAGHPPPHQAVAPPLLFNCSRKQTGATFCLSCEKRERVPGGAEDDKEAQAAPRTALLAAGCPA